jgi:bile acid:Na+ symporter, BASS family
MKIILIIFLFTLALLSPRTAYLNRITFALWVSSFVVAAFSYPFLFGSWFGFNLKIMIIPLIQVIMFGMGTTLSTSDFRLVMKMPVPVFIGLGLQYSIMPIIAFSLAGLFGFRPEIAAGIILVGCCPGGVASNLMTYISRGNVALSVTMTACSTLVSPFVTPFLMERLAGELIPIPFFSMMMSIFNMIIIPIIAGIAANGILYGKVSVFRFPASLIVLTCSGLIMAGLLFFMFNKGTSGFLAPLRGGLILGFILLSFTCLLKAVSVLWAKESTKWIDHALPIISMAGICLIIAIITSRSVEQLRTAGLLLVIISSAQCFLGYTSGYWMGRLARLNEKNCRTIAFEVGMQNSGMASGLAISVLNNIITALPPAIFGPIMNISGSVLAYHWGNKGSAKS